MGCIKLRMQESWEVNLPQKNSELKKKKNSYALFLYKAIDFMNTRSNGATL